MNFYYILVFLIYNSNAYYHKEFNLLLNNERKYVEETGFWYNAVIYTNDTLTIKFRNSENTNEYIKRTIKPGGYRKIRGIDGKREDFFCLELFCKKVCKVYIVVKKRPTSYVNRIIGIVVGTVVGVPLCIFIICKLNCQLNKRKEEIQYIKYLLNEKKRKKFFINFYKEFLIEKVQEKYVAQYIYQFAEVSKYLGENV